jgi:hypothetical protein
MTKQSDFTEEEWDLVLEGPPAAGLVVSAAERGGTIREAFSIAKEYAEAAKEHGGSELLDAIVGAKPEVDRTKHSNYEELKSYALGKLGDAVALLEQKALTEEVDDYRHFVMSVANRVAAAKKEGDEPVSEAERAAIDDIASAVGASPDDTAPGDVPEA